MLSQFLFHEFEKFKKFSHAGVAKMASTVYKTDKCVTEGRNLARTMHMAATQVNEGSKQVNECS